MAIERQKDGAGAWNNVEADGGGGGGGGGSLPAALTITRAGGVLPIGTIPLVAASLQNGGTQQSVVAVSLLNGVIPHDATSLIFENLQAILSESYDVGPAPLLTTFGLPALIYVGGDFSPGNMAALTSLDLPLLAYVGGNFSPSSMAALTSLDLPLLASVGGGFSPSSMAALTSLDLPLLAYVGGYFNPSNMAALTSLTLTSALKEVLGDVNIGGCPLDQASVDGILVRFAALDGTGGTTTYDNHTINLADLAAAPSVTGLTAKATLEGRGNTVTVN